MEERLYDESGAESRARMDGNGSPSVGAQVTSACEQGAEDESAAPARLLLGQEDESASAGKELEEQHDHAILNTTDVTSTLAGLAKAVSATNEPASSNGSCGFEGILEKDNMHEQEAEQGEQEQGRSCSCEEQVHQESLTLRTETEQETPLDQESLTLRTETEQETPCQTAGEALRESGQKRDDKAPKLQPPLRHEDLPGPQDHDDADDDPPGPQKVAPRGGGTDLDSTEQEGDEQARGGIDEKDAVAVAAARALKGADALVVGALRAGDIDAPSSVVDTKAVMESLQTAESTGEINTFDGSSVLKAGLRPQPSSAICRFGLAVRAVNALTAQEANNLEGEGDGGGRGDDARQHMPGTRVSTYWDGESSWFNGTVQKFCSQRGYRVLYDDDECHWEQAHTVHTGEREPDGTQIICRVTPRRRRVIPVASDSEADSEETPPRFSSADAIVATRERVDSGGGGSCSGNGSEVRGGGSARGKELRSEGLSALAASSAAAARGSTMDAGSASAASGSSDEGEAGDGPEVSEKERKRREAMDQVFAENLQKLVDRGMSVDALEEDVAAVVVEECSIASSRKRRNVARPERLIEGKSGRKTSSLVSAPKAFRLTRDGEKDNVTQRDFDPWGAGDKGSRGVGGGVSSDESSGGGNAVEEDEVWDVGQTNTHVDTHIGQGSVGIKISKLSPVTASHQEKVGSKSKKGFEMEEESNDDPASELDMDDDEDEDYDTMTVPDLKELLRERNLRLSGTKKELVQRLQDNDARARHSGVDGGGGGGGGGVGGRVKGQWRSRGISSEEEEEEEEQEQEQEEEQEAQAVVDEDWAEEEEEVAAGETDSYESSSADAAADDDDRALPPAKIDVGVGSVESEREREREKGPRLLGKGKREQGKGTKKQEDEEKGAGLRKKPRVEDVNVKAEENVIPPRVEKAQRHYEKFHILPPNTATVAQVKNSSAGINRWAGDAGQGDANEDEHDDDEANHAFGEGGQGDANDDDVTDDVTDDEAHDALLQELLAMSEVACVCVLCLCCVCVCVVVYIYTPILKRTLSSNVV